MCASECVFVHCSVVTFHFRTYIVAVAATAAAAAAFATVIVIAFRNVSVCTLYTLWMCVNTLFENLLEHLPHILGVCVCVC